MSEASKTPDSGDFTALETLLEHLEGVEAGCRLLRESDAAVVVFRVGDKLGYMGIGEVGAMEALWLRAAAEDLAEELLSGEPGYWIGDDVEEDEEEEEEADDDGYGEDDRFTL